MTEGRVHGGKAAWGGGVSDTASCSGGGLAAWGLSLPMTSLLYLFLPSLRFPSLCSLPMPLCLSGGGQRGHFHGKSSTTTTLPTSPLITGGRMCGLWCGWV